MKTEYAVWHGHVTYVIRAENPIRAIQAALELHHDYVPASAWHWQDMGEYSGAVQNKIRQNAITN